MDICDRILVFHRGRVVREFRKGRDDITGEPLLAAIEGDTTEAVHGVA
jgi:ABC-type sugar transport system ATPase subunit